MKFTVTVDRYDGPGYEWIATAWTKPRLSYVAKTPRKALKRLAKMMDEEGLFSD